MNTKEIQGSENNEKNLDALNKKDNEKINNQDAKALDSEEKSLSKENNKLSNNKEENKNYIDQLQKNKEKNEEKESKEHTQDIEKEKDNINLELKNSEIIVDKKIFEKSKEIYSNLDIPKECKYTDSFLLKKKRLLDLNLAK